MGVKATLPNFKSLTFDGENSRDYGVYITGQAVFNAPERNVEMVEIPGRNGSYALDKGNFNNIEVTYPAGIFTDNETDFAEAVSDFRNFLCSRTGYVRLTDDYNPNEYRLAVYKSGLEVENLDLIAGQFDIVFDCKPQRYLAIGEELVNVDVMAPVGENDRPPYLMREVPQIEGDFNTEVETLVGGTVAWNQLIKTTDIRATGTVSDVAFTNNGDGTLTVNGTASSDITPAIATSQSFINGHVYAVLTNQNSINVYLPIGGGWTAKPNDIKKVTASGSGLYIIANIPSGQAINNVKLYLQIIDLTQLFGSTIADYIYSLEQANAGAGVAWFKKLFPNPYYAYNAGELISVNASSHNTVGFNQWDGEYESGYIYNGNLYSNNSYWRTKNYVPVIPNTAYYFANVSGDGMVNCFDANKNYISGISSMGGTSHIATMPSNCHYIKFYNPNTQPPSNVCANISNADKNGTYEPYKKNTYALDSDLTLRGIPKLDTNNVLYYDGDEYEPDGTVARNKIQIDLADLDFVAYPVGSDRTAYVAAGAVETYGIKAVQTAIPNVFCSNGFTPTYQYASRWNAGEFVFTISAATVPANSIAFITENGAYTDAEAFKAAMVNHGIITELATPTTETADPFTKFQTVDKDGTESYEDYAYTQGTRDVAIPVGHKTTYGMNPHTLINPTYFDARPMLQVWGYGDIQLTSSRSTRTLSVNNAPFGTLLLANKTYSTPGVGYYTAFNANNLQLMNTGDTITVGQGTTVKYRLWPTLPAYTSITSISGEIVSGGDIDGTVTASYSAGSHYVDIVLDSFDYTYATSGATQSLTFDVSLTIAYTSYGTAYTWTGVANFIFQYYPTGTHAQQIWLLGSISSATPTFPSALGSQFDSQSFYESVNGESTKTPIDAQPVYVDLDIGEAYTVTDDIASSVNNSVTIPAELPTLPSGNTEVTHDNTITQLKVQTRWWKV